MKELRAVSGVRTSPHRLVITQTHLVTSTAPVMADRARIAGAQAQSVVLVGAQQGHVVDRLVLESPSSSSWVVHTVLAQPRPSLTTAQWTYQAAGGVIQRHPRAPADTVVM